MKAQKERKQQPVKIIPATSSNIYLALSFVFPFVIMGTAFALNKVYPFGNRQIIILDFYNQYFPFLSGFWHKLREGTLSTWSWTAGGGHDYVALIAYYMASPLNLLAMILPHVWLRETLTIILLIKIGCAGLFTSIYLRYAYKEHSPALSIFSSFYALCAFTLGYYWNIMWFDAFALLPLVMLGLMMFMQENRYRIYIIALALSVFANYYIGFYICIFTLTVFIGQCVIQRLNRKEFFRKLALIAAYSILAIGMTAVLIFPSISALQNTYKAENIFPKLALYYSFFDILGNFIAFTPPTIVYGLPNLYCGMLCILLIGLFIYSSKIPLRDKLVFMGIATIFLISCNINVLDYLLNGFRTPNQVTFRFSFLVSFTLVTMAYRAFILTGSMNRRSLLAMGISTALVLLAAVFGHQQNIYIIGSAALCIIYLLLFYLLRVKTGKWRVVIMSIFFLTILIELITSSSVGVMTALTYPRDKYPDRNNQIQALLKMRQPARADFYRTEMDSFYTYNDPYLYNYNGISLFSSTINTDVTKFMTGLGLLGLDKDNSFNYTATSPLTSIFLNLRYLISREGYLADNGTYWKTVAKKGDSLLLENKYYLPLGFMAENKLVAYDHHNKNPFGAQNTLFQLSTGLKGSLFAITELPNINSIHENIENNMRIWNYKMPSDGVLYAYCESDTDDIMVIFNNDFLVRHLDLYKAYPNIFSVGSFSKGDIVTFTKESTALINIGLLDSELFEQGYNLLARAPLNLTKFTNTQVCGNVTALEDGLLYTSIPGDKNWSVYVDGTKSKIVLIDNAMAAVRLNKGYHEIEFRYFNKSFAVGIVVSLASLGAFIAMVVLGKKRGRIFTSNGRKGEKE